MFCLSYMTASNPAIQKYRYNGHIHWKFYHEMKFILRLWPNGFRQLSRKYTNTQTVFSNFFLQNPYTDTMYMYTQDFVSTKVTHTPSFIATCHSWLNQAKTIFLSKIYLDLDSHDPICHPKLSPCKLLTQYTPSLNKLLRQYFLIFSNSLTDFDPSDSICNPLLSLYKLPTNQTSLPDIITDKLLSGNCCYV